MKWLLTFSILCLFAIKSKAQREKFLVNKYWQYNGSIMQQDKSQVYIFRAIPKDSIQEIAMYFKADGGFKEVVTRKHPKPARTGRWHMQNDVLIIDFDGNSKTAGWKYKMLYIDAKQFQCITSK